jgi:predicted O-linked N-acetylglucosamine transferase (SPINDLY family)
MTGLKQNLETVTATEAMRRAHQAYAAGRFDAADRLCTAVRRAEPGHAGALQLLGAIRLGQDRPAEAEQLFAEAAKADPANAAIASNHGLALLALERYQEAIHSFDRALRLQLDLPEAWYHRGLVKWRYGALRAAETDMRVALLLRPALVDALLNMGNVLKDAAQYLSAVASFERALAVRPGLTVAGSNIVFVKDHLPGLGFAEHQALRRDWARRFVEGRIEPMAAHANTRVPGRRIAVGYVSNDFIEHSAATCFGAVLRNHDRSQFHVVCYSSVDREDQRTEAFRAMADLWRPVPVMSDEALAQRIRDDGIDILVDLGGHTARNRLRVFARKPAPVQVTAWGHAHGTGLRQIDYLFADPVAVPEAVRGLFAERIADLPCTIPFDAPPGAPEVAVAPVVDRGHVTFGSYNRFEKVSPASRELWARILVACPDARLVFKAKALDDPAVRRALSRFFEARGVAAGRLRFLGATNRHEHLASFAEIDVALDPFPQGGGVSTFEALWMGVPVITLLGNSVPQRISGSILTAVGLDDCVARDEDEYVAIAARLAADATRLADLRSGMRARVMASEAGDAVRYTRAVEARYRDMWRTWCETPA